MTWRDVAEFLAWWLWVAVGIGLIFGQLVRKGWVRPR